MRVLTQKLIGYVVATAAAVGLAVAPAQAAPEAQPSPSHGEIEKYASEHPELGKPTRAERSIRGGATQSFEHGDVHWSPTAGTHWTHDGMNSYWASRGWENGFLGYPTSDEKPVTGGTEQDFQGGVLFWRRQTGAVHAVRGAIRSRYTESGAVDGSLGFPLNDERHLRKAGGVSQEFEHGQIHWTRRTGAHITHAGIQSFWSSRGWENGFLGYPTGEEESTKGAASQTFQGGTLFWNGKNGAVHSVKGANLGAYRCSGYWKGFLGFPTSEERHSRKGGGVSQLFEHGQIHWSPRTGAHATHGGIQSFWASHNWEFGFLGYPTGDELHVKGGASQTFQGGTLFWNGRRGDVHSVRGLLLGQYRQHRYEQGNLGFPTGEQTYFQEGIRQTFEHGTLEWRGCKLGWQNPRWAFQTCSCKTSTDPEAPRPTLWAADSRHQAVEKFIGRAYQYLNTPYRWDWAAQPGQGIDCAGLVMQGLYADGMNLGWYNSVDHLRGVDRYGHDHSHYAGAMSVDGHFMSVPLSQIRRGDLIFYPGHVAIYLGGTSIIESYPPRVRINNNMWYMRATGARRPLI